MGYVRGDMTNALMITCCIMKKSHKHCLAMAVEKEAMFFLGRFTLSCPFTVNFASNSLRLEAFLKKVWEPRLLFAGQSGAQASTNQEAANERFASIRCLLNEQRKVWIFSTVNGCLAADKLSFLSLEVRCCEIVHVIPPTQRNDCLRATDLVSIGSATQRPNNELLFNINIGVAPPTSSTQWTRADAQCWEISPV